MTSSDRRAALTPRAGVSTMRLPAAVAVSAALHAAALALGGGQPGRASAPEANALTVSLGGIQVARRESAQRRSTDDVGAQSDLPPAAAELPDDGAPALGHGPVIREYFPSDALTRLPEAITEFDALFPGNVEPPPGKLELRLWLSREGVIDKLEVLHTDAPDTLASVALAAFRQMRFRAGEIRGVPVGSTTDIVVEFAPAAAAPAGATP